MGFNLLQCPLRPGNRTLIAWNTRDVAMQFYLRGGQLWCEVRVNRDRCTATVRLVLVISHELICYESNRGHEIDGTKPNQTGTLCSSKKSRDIRQKETDKNVETQHKDSIAVATNSRSMIFVTFVSCARWYVCVFNPIYSGASLRLSVYV